MPVVWYCHNSCSSKFSSLPYWHTNLKVCLCKASQTRVLRVPEREQMVTGRRKWNRVLWIWQKIRGSVIWCDISLSSLGPTFTNWWRVGRSANLLWLPVETLGLEMQWLLTGWLVGWFLTYGWEMMLSSQRDIVVVAQQFYQQATKRIYFKV